MNQSKQLKPQSKPQFIRFDRGISQFNHDYYAALGLPIISNHLYIRNVYLRIARILHPDVYGFSAEEKEIATQYLAKLVNPAYNMLMKEQDRQAYQSIFKLLAMRLMQRSRNIQIHSEMACELMITPSDEVYERFVTEIAKVQYQSLTNILEHTAEISELNLVYILYKAGYHHGAANMPPVLAPMVSPKTTKAHVQNFLPPPSKPSYAYNLKYVPDQSSNNLQSSSDATILQESDATVIQERADRNNIQMINNRLNMCEIYIMQSDWNAALRDLRDILQIDQNNSKCLAMLGVVYQNINQPQMAKASFKRSLQINPQEGLALKYLLEFDDSSQSNSIAKKNSITKANPNINQKTNQKINQKETPPQRSWILKLREWIASHK
jgi:curved DNA-binding protein CbpA